MADSEAPNHPLLPPDFKPIEGVEPYKGWYYLWKYVPSIPAAGVFAGVFLIVTVLVTWKAWKSRTWYCIILSVGGLCELMFLFLPLSPPLFPLLCFPSSSVQH